MIKVVSFIESAIYRARNAKYLEKSRNGLELYKKPIDRFTTEYRSFNNGKPIRTITEKVIPDKDLNRAWKYPFDSAHIVEKDVFDHQTKSKWQVSNVMKITKNGDVTYNPAENAPYYQLLPNSFLQIIRNRNFIVNKAKTTKGKLIALEESVKCKDNVYRHKVTTFNNGEKKVYTPENC